MNLSIATWNLWNSAHRQRERLEAAAAVLRRIAPDVVALQEVATSIADPGPGSAASFLAGSCGYPHVIVSPYPDDPGEGLALLSRFPISRLAAPELDACALRVEVDTGSGRVGVTNVHLDYASIATRERQVREVTRHIDAERGAGRYEVLAGDFNAIPSSSVYRFLQGQQTLDGAETVPWHDLAGLEAARHGLPAPATLDKLTNPRWRTEPALESPMRVDWILVRDGFAEGLPSPTLEASALIGTDPAGPASVVPSDHYGVVAELHLSNGY